MNLVIFAEKPVVAALLQVVPSANVDDNVLLKSVKSYDVEIKLQSYLQNGTVRYQWCNVILLYRLLVFDVSTSR